MSETLADLLDGFVQLPAGAASARDRVAVRDLTLDSREVRAGSVFLALRGARAHGLEFAADAAARGASAVLWDPDGAPGAGLVRAAEEAAARSGAVVARVEGLRSSVGRIADRFFGRPSAQLRVIGITGTNGKTTCAYLLAQALSRAGSDAAYIGTVGIGRVGALEAPTHTTPDAVTVHRLLAKLRAQGVSDVAMEVSSHALDQGRVDGVRFRCAAFTNLTRDHLDYHGSMQAYGAAKARLLDAAGLEHIILNVGDAFCRDLARRSAGRAPVTAVWVGTEGAGWAAQRAVWADEVELDLRGISMKLRGDFGEQRLATRLLGRFNAENCVIVAACLLALGVPAGAAAAALGACAAPPGRMEVVASTREPRPLAVIDYAHSPDALAKALRALREHCRGALWCVFGCGGDRDPGKRPMMGRVADELADEIIVTDDNPRSENPQSICAAILRGISSHVARVIHDRGEAIAAALTQALPVDVVLIAGKGHEDYQIYGDVRRRFSDREAAARCFGEAA
jgi:UDP-N-acetylmuramoyl-L-alanyl-D-glutamate--2,6-diaminopimelate ligase